MAELGVVLTVLSLKDAEWAYEHYKQDVFETRKGIPSSVIGRNPKR